jgi:hypothetical protein
VKTTTYFKLAKTAILFLFLAFSFSCKKTELPEPEVPEVPEVPSEPTLYVSQPGTPTGSPTSATISTAGGTLSTPDGALTLTFPAGALNSDTEISITPITNNAPKGLASAAYRLEPEGIVFNAPVELKFNYETFDLTGTPEDFLWITTQAANGSWEAAIRSIVDTAANTVAVNVPHFSDWAIGRFIEMGLSPSSASLAKGQTLRLFTLGFKPILDDDDDLTPLYPMDFNNGELVPLVPIRPNETKLTGFQIINWSLNGAAAPTSGSNGNLTPNDFQAVYQAPQEVPSPNTVAVSLNLKANNYLGGISNFILTSSITIIDAEFYLTANIAGLEETYYPFESYPDGVPDGAPYVTCQNVLGRMMIWTYIIPEDNSSTTLQWLMMEFQGLEQGVYPLISEECGGESTVFYYPNSNDAETFYDTQKNIRTQTPNGDCEVSTECTDFYVQITSYDPETKIIEGNFSGDLAADDPENVNNCVSEEATPITGTFRLKVAG